MKITDTFYWQSKRFRIAMIRLFQEISKIMFLKEIAVFLKKYIYERTNRMG